MNAKNYHLVTLKNNFKRKLHRELLFYCYVIQF